MRYRHIEWGEVTIIQAFDSFVTISTPSGIKSAMWAELTEIKDNVVGLHTPLGKPEAKGEQKESVDNPPEDNRLNINKAPYTTIANALPSVGRLPAKRIVERRNEQPERRYRSFRVFKKVNADLFDNDEVWEILEPLIKFEDD